MESNAAVLIGMAAVAFTALAAFAVYRWRQRRRAHQVEKGVKAYLCGRYGGVPEGLDINDCDDPL